jgi:hypothetical protein
MGRAFGAQEATDIVAVNQGWGVEVQFVLFWNGWVGVRFHGVCGNENVVSRLHL